MVVLKKPKLSVGYTCFLCMSNSQDDIVLNPSNNSYVVLWDSLTRLTRSNHDCALRVLFPIGGRCTTEKLQNLDVRWHLKCYKSFTHKKTVNTAEGRFANLMELEEKAANLHLLRTHQRVLNKLLTSLAAMLQFVTNVMVSSVTYRVRSPISFEISHMTSPGQHWHQLWNYPEMMSE